MPSLDRFPKSHIITFEYYVGVIHFLEEDYAKVSPALFALTDSPSRSNQLITIHHRPKPISRTLSH